MAKPQDNWIHITIGATIYAFKIGAQGIRIFPKPFAGEIQRQTGVLTGRDQIDAPLRIVNLSGLGVSQAGPFQADADNRYFEGVNIDAYPGMWCKGPLGRVPTDIAGTHQIRGFAEALDNLYYFADVVGSITTESVAYFTGSNTTWNDATLVADFNSALGINRGFNCVGLVAHRSAGAGLVVWAMRDQGTTGVGLPIRQMVRGGPTVWTVIDHVNAADAPAGDASGQGSCVGLIEIGTTMYTVTRGAAGATGGPVTLRQNGTDGVQWTDTFTTNLYTGNPVRKLLVYVDSAGVLRPFVILREGIWYYDGTSWAKFADFTSKVSATNGLAAFVWQSDDIPAGYLVCNVGEELYAFYWSTDNVPVARRIDIGASQAQGLPVFRQGPVTAVGHTHGVFWAAIGGDTSARTGGVYKRTAAAPPLGWQGPIYDIATANRQIRAMHLSTMDDGTIRLHAAVDNGTANDTDPIFFQDVTRDPRQVSGYQHTAANSQLILPKMDMGLADILGIYRNITVTGTGLSATNLVGAVYVSVDAAPLNSAGAWGTTRGSITASAGSVNFSATPAGTGQSVRAIQARLDLTGASNASPYIEGVIIFYVKRPAPKFIRVIPVDVEGSRTGLRSIQRVLDDLEACQAAATDWQVDYGQEVDLVMEPYNAARALDYVNTLLRAGSVGAQTAIREAVLIGVDV